MKPRKVKFDILPADAIAIDVASNTLGLTEEQAGRFIYQVGLSTLFDMEEPVRHWAVLRQYVQGQSLDRQRNQTNGISRYELDTGDYLDDCIVLPTRRELELNGIPC
jgi:hypothetical protein